MDNKASYFGRIGNTAQQYVSAAIKPQGLGVKPKVIKGGDLRSSKSKG